MSMQSTQSAQKASKSDNTDEATNTIQEREMMNTGKYNGKHSMAKHLPLRCEVSGAEGMHETIFDLNELLKLQVSIAGSLEMAALAFRPSHLGCGKRQSSWSGLPQRNAVHT